MFKRRRLYKLMTLIVSVLAVVALLGVEHADSLFTPGSDAPAGRAKVHDGDSIRIDDYKIRLEGIDAPELKQRCGRKKNSTPCGIEARDALRGLVKGKTVRCTVTGKDRYKRLLAHCWAGEVNINGWMVSQGHALAYRAYTPRYVPEEVQARVQRKGIHNGYFQEPWEWRKDKREGYAAK